MILSEYELHGMGNPLKRNKSILKTIYTDFVYKKGVISFEVKALCYEV